MGSNYINMWNKFASKVDPNVLRQRIFEEAERINNTFREPIADIKANAREINKALNTIYPKGKTLARGNYGTVKITNPQVLGKQFAQSTPVAVAKQGIGKTPIIGAGIGLIDTAINAFKPGTNPASILSDLGATASYFGGPWIGGLTGAKLGSKGGLIGTGIGTVAGLGLGLYNRKLGELQREANIPYNEINQREFQKRYDELKALEESGQLAKGYADRYKLAFEGKLKPTSTAIEEQLNDTSAQDWLNQIMLDGQNYNVPNINYNQLPNNRLPQPPQSLPTGDNGYQGISYPSQYLGGVNGAPTSAYNVPSSIDVLAQMMGYGQQGYNQQPTVQPDIPADDRDFRQRIYDRVDELRDEENRPILRPKAEIDGIQQNNQPMTYDDIMLKRLEQLNKFAEKQPRYKDYDPIQRMWIAKAGGMTPYQVWGDYPNQNTRLKNLYDILGKEYEIRKDMEDRARLDKYRDKLILNYQNDPELQMIVSNPELYKTYLQHIGKDRINYPLDMSKKEFDRNTQWFNTALTGQNTLANTALRGQLGLNELDYKTLGQILTNTYKAQTPDINKVYGYNTQRDIASANNQLRADLANQNAKLRWELGQLRQYANPGDKALIDLVATGALSQEDANNIVKQLSTKYLGGTQGGSIPITNLEPIDTGIGSLFQ